MLKSFNIKKGDIITITGAGGKTSLMFSLAQELSNLGKVLVTTTTKIYLPNTALFEKLLTSKVELTGKNHNIFIYGEDILDNKLTSLSYEKIFALKKDFDFILIEGDGAKEKLLKFWNNYEPCIPPFSTKVIGVVNLDISASELNSDTIHRFEIFKENFPNFISTTVSADFIINYIEKGMFFKGFNSSEKYIFLNGVDGENYLDKFSLAMEVCNSLTKKDSQLNFVLGSIQDDYYFNFSPTDAVIMASGFSKRMGKNKLSLPYRDTTLLSYILEKISLLPFFDIYISGREEWVEKLAENFNCNYIENSNAHLGQSESVKLGVLNSKGEGIVFFPGDQPFITTNSLLKLYFNFQLHKYITIPRAEGENFSPVFFPKDKRKELLNLSGDTGGREVIKNSSLISFVEFPSKDEFKDIDTPEEYQNIYK